MGALANKVAGRIRYLDAIKYPDNVICSHFGDYIWHGNLNINISPCKSYGTLLITMYDRRATTKGHCRFGQPCWAGEQYVGYSEHIHHARADSVAKEIGATIVNQWNGGDYHTGISIVLDRPCPSIVLTGVGNYHAMPRVFEPTPEEKQGFKDYVTAVATTAILESINE